MKRHGPILVLVGILAVLAVGLAVLFRLRLAQGDVFPAYSSLRADPLGTRALHDALAQTPGLRVTRLHGPISDWAAAPRRSIVIAGLAGREWSRVTREEFDALDGALRGGSRVLIAFRAAVGRDQMDRDAEKKAKEEQKKKKKKSVDDDEPEERPVVYTSLKQRWGADVKDRRLFERDGAVATRTDDPRAAGLPEKVGWQSEVYFEVEPDAGWHVLYRRGGSPVLVERTVGAGSLVLAADSYFLSNEALENDRATALLAWVVGPHHRVEFDEAHLGVMATPGVAALARRYGLSAAFFTLLVLAGLFVWQRVVLFVPPGAEEQDMALTYHPAAGLEALLRRSVSADELIATCATEWKLTARESQRARVDLALAQLSPKASAVERYNAVVRALRREVRGQKSEVSGKAL